MVANFLGMEKFKGHLRRADGFKDEVQRVHGPADHEARPEAVPEVEEPLLPGPAVR